MRENGAKIWVFADGYLPVKSGNGSSLEAHEALMILNTSVRPAQVQIDIYFEDRKPVKGISLEVPPERVITLRLDRPEHIGGVVIPPLTQYALRLHSNINVVVQFGRLDTTQSNLSYYINVGYACSQ